jgi:hypothetical protein
MGKRRAAPGHGAAVGRDRVGHPALLRLFGEDLLRALGVSLAAFRIAGGIMLF